MMAEDQYKAQPGTGNNHRPVHPSSFDNNLPAVTGTDRLLFMRSLDNYLVKLLIIL
jgi:hypothetical protein